MTGNIVTERVARLATQETSKDGITMHFQARYALHLLVAGAAALIAVAAAEAEEGVWTFENLPSKALQTKYGFATPSTSLTALRLSAVRFAGPIAQWPMPSAMRQSRYSRRSASKKRVFVVKW